MVHTQAWHSLSSYAPTMKLCKFQPHASKMHSKWAEIVTGTRYEWTVTEASTLQINKDYGTRHKRKKHV